MRKYAKGSLFVFAAVLFLFASAGYASAATYYVAVTGNDLNSGTQVSPFRSVNKGVSVLTPGDTLYIMSGTYAESLNDNIPSGTSWSAPVTIAAYPGQAITLKPNLGAGWVLHFQGAQQYIVIDGLILDGANVSYDAVKITDSGAGSANHIRIQNTEITNAAQQSILITGRYSDYNEFINLNVHNNRGVGSMSPDHYHGLYIETSNNLVERSAVHDNTGYGVHIYNSDGWTANNNIVRNNRIYNNGNYVGSYAAGMILGSGDGNLAYNNLVWSNNGGIQIAYTNPSNTKVYNNTVYGNRQFGVYVNTDSGNAVIENNIFYSDTLPEIQNYGIKTVIDHNLSGTNPLFVDASNANFRLQSGSPAIDAGVVVSIAATDIAGTSRPQGSAYDIGAYEYVFSDTTPPSVSITSPANGATVSGIVTVSASASDNVGVAGVQFKVDGANLGVEVVSAPYTIPWNTTTATNGSHILTAIARDAAGNTATSTESITVNNPVADTTPPSVPTGLSAVAVSSSQINLSWTASTDNVGVTGYKIYRNGTQIATVATTSYSDTGLAPSTTYSYTVAAYDAAGNQSAQSSSASATTQSASTQKFQIGDRIQTTASVNVRSKPSLKHSQILGTQPVGALGTVIGGPQTGSGYTWWNINYDNQPDGWSVENYLQKVVATAPALFPALTQEERSQQIVDLERQLAALRAQLASLLNALGR